MKLTFLGTGTSFGIPIIGCNCVVCQSTDARDKRTRVGAVVESDTGTRVLFDTPPELRLQLVRAGIGRVEAVFFTHDHADHIHGIDDIRAITVRQRAPIPMYAEPAVLKR
ncbi:MAG: MBL fold metallo-hydrolase, partial [Gemmatimonadaceae bacterium]